MLFLLSYLIWFTVMYTCSMSFLFLIVRDYAINVEGWRMYNSVVFDFDLVFYTTFASGNTSDWWQTKGGNINGCFGWRAQGWSGALQVVRDLAASNGGSASFVGLFLQVHEKPVERATRKWLSKNSTVSANSFFVHPEVMIRRQTCVLNQMHYIVSWNSMKFDFEFCFGCSRMRPAKESSSRRTFWGFDAIFFYSESACWKEHNITWRSPSFLLECLSFSCHFLGGAQHINLPLKNL